MGPVPKGEGRVEKRYGGEWYREDNICEPSQQRC